MQFRKQQPSRMAPTNPAPEGTIVVSAEDAEAQALADERQLEFRARHQLTIDAQAFTVLEPKYARELRAVPIGIEAGQPVVAVADPSEKRLEELRSRIPGDVKFVLVAPESLDALLKSRIFVEGENGHGPVVPPPEVKLTTTADPAQPAPVEPPPNEEAPAPVEPPPAQAAPAQAPAAPAAAAQPIPTELFDAANVNQLAAQLAQAAETLLALQSQVQGIAAQFEQTRQELREQKEQLAAAAAKSDQDRARIKSVAASLAEDVARLEATKTDLAERLSGLVLDDQAG